MSNAQCKRPCKKIKGQSDTLRVIAKPRPILIYGQNVSKKSERACEHVMWTALPLLRFSFFSWEAGLINKVTRNKILIVLTASV